MRSSFGTVSAWGVTITAMAPRFSAICASSVAARVPLWLAPTITGIAPAAATAVRISSARSLSSRRLASPSTPRTVMPSTPRPAMKRTSRSKDSRSRFSLSSKGVARIGYTPSKASCVAIVLISAMAVFSGARGPSVKGGRAARDGTIAPLTRKESGEGLHGYARQSAQARVARGTAASRMLAEPRQPRVGGNLRRRRLRLGAGGHRARTGGPAAGAPPVARDRGISGLRAGAAVLERYGRAQAAARHRRAIVRHSLRAECRGGEARGGGGALPAEGRTRRVDQFTLQPLRTGKGLLCPRRQRDLPDRAGGNPGGAGRDRKDGSDRRHRRPFHRAAGPRCRLRPSGQPGPSRSAGGNGGRDQTHSQGRQGAGDPGLCRSRRQALARARRAVRRRNLGSVPACPRKRGGRRSLQRLTRTRTFHRKDAKDAKKNSKLSLEAIEMVFRH